MSAPDTHETTMWTFKGRCPFCDSECSISIILNDWTAKLTWSCPGCKVKAQPLEEGHDLH